MDKTRIFNAFIDFYDQLTDSHLTEGSTGIGDDNEIKMIDVGIATALTINKILEEE